MKKYAFEVVHIDSEGNEVVSHFDAISMKSLKQMLQAKSINAVQVRRISGFRGNILGAVAWYSSFLLACIFCIGQVIVYLAIAQVYDDDFFHMSESYNAAEILAGAAGSAFAATMFLFAALFVSILCKLTALQTGYRYISNRLFLLVVAWLSLNFASVFILAARS